MHWRPLEVQSLRGRERRAEGQQGAGLTVCAGPASCPPRPHPRSATGSPAPAVLRRGDPGASIIVVSILVVAALTLGHALHLVLIEERLAGWALWVATWGGHRAGRTLPSQARWWGCPGRHPSLSPRPEGGRGEAGAPLPRCLRLCWGDEAWPPWNSLPSPSVPGRSIRQCPRGFRQVLRQGSPQGW